MPRVNMNMKMPGVLLLLAGMAFSGPVAVPQTSGPKATAPPKTKAPSSAAERAAAQAAATEADETLARTYMATKRYAEAAALFEKLAKANPRNVSYLNMAGIAHMQGGDLKGARTWFQRCTKVAPAFADAYNNIGATWYTEDGR